MSKIPMMFRDWWTELDALRPGHSLDRQQSSSSVASDKDAFHAVVDVQQFSPNEITVKVTNNNVLVECKHEEKEDEHGFISRTFSRRFVIPETHDIEKIVSSLSSDGILTISAPKKSTNDNKTERMIPINQTGPAASA